MNPTLLIGAALAAYYFRDQIASLFGGQSSAAPGISAAAAAAGAATAAGATPAAAANAAASAAAATPPAPIAPTVAYDNPAVHPVLSALAAAEDAAQLAAAESQFQIPDSRYLQTVSQWNWYRSTAGLGGIIYDATDSGNSAIPASLYLQYREARGLTTPTSTAARTAIRPTPGIVR